MPGPVKGHTLVTLPRGLVRDLSSLRYEAALLSSACCGLTQWHLQCQKKARSHHTVSRFPCFPRRTKVPGCGLNAEKLNTQQHQYLFMYK